MSTDPTPIAPLGDAELADIKAAIEATTPGTWEAVNRGGTFSWIVYPFRGSRRAFGTDGTLRPADGEWIAKSREACLLLIGEIERLRAEAASGGPRRVVPKGRSTASARTPDRGRSSSTAPTTDKGGRG